MMTKKYILTKRSKISSWNPEIEVCKSSGFHCKVVGVDAPKFVIQSTHQPINQSVSQSINQSINQNQSTYRASSKALKEPFNQFVNQAINHSIMQPIRQLFNLLIKSALGNQINQALLQSISVTSLSFRQDAHNLLAQKVIDLSKVPNPRKLVGHKFSTPIDNVKDLQSFSKKNSRKHR